MEWSNEKCLEFLEAFRSEPSLWDPKQEAYKNRHSQADAWRRIAQSLSFQVTIDDLKKKRETLMGYYRVHLNKYKKSLKSGASEPYSTSWFAYDFMHSFLLPVYIGDNTLKGGSTSPLPESAGRRPSSSRSNISLKTGQSCIKTLPPEITACNKQVDKACSCHKSASSQKRSRELDEYDHFGSMIAAKIRKMNDDDERETVMNTIQNVVFQSIMKIASTTRNATISSSSITIKCQPPDIDNSSSNSTPRNDPLD